MLYRHEWSTLNVATPKGLIDHLIDGVYGLAVLVAWFACVWTIGSVAESIGLSGGAHELVQFASMPLTLWGLVVVAKKPQGSLVLRAILAYGLVAGAAVTFSGSRLDIEASCRTGWVGEECKEFMRDRAALLPILGTGWVVVCACLLGALSKFPSAPKGEATTG